MDDLKLDLHNQHTELSELWRLYRIYYEKPVKDDSYWKDVAISFSAPGMIKSDFSAGLARFFMFMLDKKFGGLSHGIN